MAGKKSSAYKADLAAAKEAAYQYAHNPFEEGTRAWKMCEKSRAHKAAMDSILDELEAVYGPAGTRRPVIGNVPGSFTPAPMAASEA